METKTATEQFVDDYLLVAMNDQPTYAYLMGLIDEIVKGNEYPFYIAEQLQEDYETTMSEMIGAGDTVDKLIARQMLLGWGMEPFSAIVRHLLQYHKENEAVA
jgi:hypothetical protein